MAASHEALFDASPSSRVACRPHVYEVCSTFVHVGVAGGLSAYGAVLAPLSWMSYLVLDQVVATDVLRYDAGRRLSDDAVVAGRRPPYYQCVRVRRQVWISQKRRRSLPRRARRRVAGSSAGRTYTGAR
jgi:hypothetical protein